MRTSGEILSIIRDQPLINPHTGEAICNSELVGGELGPAFQYAQAVESEVPESANMVRTLLPQMDSELSDFFDFWESQEVSHGQAQLVLLEKLELPPGKQVQKGGLAVEVGGLLAKVSAGFHDIAEAGVITYAGLGEKEVQSAYTKMVRQLLQLGEVDLVNDLMDPMTHQESLHLAYYRAAFLERRARLKPWQLKTVSKIIEAVYWPVGVQRNNRERKAAFGNMALLLSANPYGPAIEAQTLAATLLKDAVPSSPFIEKRYKECIEEFQAT